MSESETETGDAVARRLEWGQTRESLRAELIDDGLPEDLVEGLLYEERPTARRMWPLRAIAGTVASVAGFVVLPVAGVVAGVMAIPGTDPDSRVCGAYWIVQLTMGAVLGMGGLVVGVVSACLFAQFALTLGLNRSDGD